MSDPNTEGASVSTDFFPKKFSYLFKWFDQTGDGWITRDDIERMSGRFCSLAEETDQKNRGLMDNGFMNWWYLLLEACED